MKYLWIMFVLFVLAVAGIVATWYSQPKENADGYVPMTRDEHRQVFDQSENGYHVFADAMNALVSPDTIVQDELDEIRSGGTVTAGALAYIESNTTTLDLVHDGLNHEYVLTPRYDYESEDPDQWWGNARSLARLGLYDGTRLSLDGKHDQAMERYLDVLRLGHFINEQAVLIESMIGVAIERIALDSIFDLIPKLDVDALDTLAKELNHIQVNSPPFDHILANERAVMDETGQVGIVGRIIYRRMVEKDLGPSRHIHDVVESRIIGMELRARTRIYTLEHGDPPESLSTVIPDKRVPVDPLTGNPFQLVDGKIFSEGPRFTDDAATVDSPIDGRSVF